MIKIENLFKKYGENIIFENSSFHFEDNILTAIMGKSGIGKTTLLRIIMNLEKCDKGNIAGLENKKIAAVFQEDRLCENLSSIKNISIVCEKNITEKEIKKELNNIGLSGSENKIVKN